ncbi:Pkinase domain-containing protein [Cephalotus follicularis]|uniref:Pkinase domain-containing protein n=1 Tax=Cephalotus follicularis TaxID=3775 RepID=A0A1Q3BX45_CEPFO|nr:Pkinase domain-containing protein [Cephalotus follicularis]
MAVKSAEFSVSSTLQQERQVLNNVQGCPYILRCYGEETTTSKDGDMVYNVLLEYASGGTLAHLINNGGLQETHVKRYTRSLLIGLQHIHACGYVHCDIKPENILLVPSKNGDHNKFVAKIGDFGLAKRSELSKRHKFDPYLRGTSMYMAPESVTGDRVQEPPSDIWALGCVVLQMLTGKRAWETINSDDFMSRISDKYVLPKIPSDVSKEGREFLKGCFVKNPMLRLTAEMLLNLPFVQDLNEMDELLEDVPDDALKINFSFALYNGDDDDEDEFRPAPFSDASFSDDLRFTGDSQISYFSEDDEFVKVQVPEEDNQRESKRKKLFDDNVNCLGNVSSIPTGV